MTAPTCETRSRSVCGGGHQEAARPRRSPRVRAGALDARGLGVRGLTWQSSQHSPCAHTASGFRVHVVALQQRLVHSWRRGGGALDRVIRRDQALKANTVP